VETLQSLAAGFAVILTPANLYYCFLGSLVGTLVGVLPGIGPLAALSLLLPFTFTLPPVASLVMLSAIFYGLRISLAVGVVSTVLALVIGLAAGLAAAYIGGRLEMLIMRVVDIQLSFPSILIALILIAVLGQGTGKVITALVTVQWAYYARTVRSAALVEKRKEYIEAAHCLALSPARIVFRHLLPNCLPPMIVVATVQVAAAIALEATLSFLGLGLPITEPSLGLLIANGYQYLLSGKYWISFFPGLALLVTIVSINLVADQLRDVLNPRLQR
jgi:peptide/nickel transport system permease protein